MAKASKLLVKLILCLILQGVVVLSKSLSLYRDRPFVEHFDRKMVSKGYDRFIVGPRPRADEPSNEKPSNEKPPNEESSNEKSPNETPVSDEGKNKMGSFKIDDGDVIGGGVYEIKPDGIVDVDIKIKISPGASSPALCPAQPCPSEAPKEQNTKEGGGADPENQEKTTAAANTSNKPGEKPESTETKESEPSKEEAAKPENPKGEAPDKAKTPEDEKPESTETKESEPSKEEAAKPENPKGEAPDKTKTPKDEKPEGSAEGDSQSTPSTKGQEENTKPTTKGSEDKDTPKPDGSGEAPESSGDAATALSDASQGPFIGTKQTKERTKLRLASKELPELNKLKEALSDAAANWAFNLRNGRRREYMERPRIHYTHQNFVPYYNIQY